MCMAARAQIHLQQGADRPDPTQTSSAHLCAAAAAGTEALGRTGMAETLCSAVNSRVQVIRGPAPAAIQP